MTPKDTSASKLEDLLWELSQLPGDADPMAIDDDLLIAYRRGELSPELAETVERRLAKDDPAASRLAQLAALESEQAPPEAEVTDIGRRRTGGAAQKWLLAAAIVLAVVATAALFYQLRTEPEQRAALSGVAPPYAVTVYGVTERRGVEPSTATLLGSTVRIVARPAGAARPGMQFALYRHQPTGLMVRIPAAQLRTTINRGTAVLEADAATLAGSGTEVSELVLLVLPAGTASPAGTKRNELEAWARDRGLGFHPFEVQLVPEETTLPENP